nr:immunoglobulin heavy chain junction region [Macaca mulatta]
CATEGSAWSIPFDFW